MNKYLYLSKRDSVKGGKDVFGGVKLFLRPRYGSNSPIRTNTVEGKAVTELDGAYKIDSFMAKQIKYLFDVDLKEDSFLNVQVSLWGKPAESILKFNPETGDLYMLFATNAKLVDFERKSGETGYQLRVTAFDFDLVKRNNSNERQQNPTTNTQSYPQQSPGDFELMDDNDDLPF